jgi:hypothetical protein
MKLKDEHKNLLLGALAAKTFQSKPKEKKENVFFNQFSNELNLFQKLWTWIFWVIIFLSKKFFTIILIIALLAVIANFFMLVTEEYNECSYLPPEIFEIYPMNLLLKFDDCKNSIVFFLGLSTLLIILRKSAFYLLSNPRFIFWITFSPALMYFLFIMITQQPSLDKPTETIEEMVSPEKISDTE